MQKLIALLVVAASANFAPAQVLEDTQSPDARIRLHVRLDRQPSYEIFFRSKLVVEAGRIGLDFLGRGPLQNLILKRVTRNRHHSSYELLTGKASRIINHYEGLLLEFRESTAPWRRLNVEFRVFDDAVAFRYVIPKQNAFSEFQIGEELSAFSVPESTQLSALNLPFASTYEDYYQTAGIATFTPGQKLGLPLLMGLASGAWIGFSEAALTDYANLYLTRSAESPNRLEARLAPWPKQPELKVKGRTPFESPWRVFLIGDKPGALLESNVIYNLNDPQALTDTSWIKFGKVHFPWWNAYYMPGDTQLKSGVNTWTLKRYIDFCAANGVAFHSLDGLDKAWYGGPTSPYEGADVTQAIPEINLPEVLAYARTKGVGTRAWLHWEGLAKGGIEHVLSTYEKWGLSGIMVDFLDRDDQEMVRFHHEVIRAAALHHLTVNFHGIFKPTGLSRTYPNLLSVEAVLGTEYNKWGKGATPDHEIMTAFVRMMAGPLDTHQGSFVPVPEKKFVVEDPPHAYGTLARQLALYVVYENHLPMVADYPEAYLRNPVAFEFVREVPATWDETKVLASEMGQYLVIGRRKGTDWYIGGITNSTARNIEFQLPGDRASFADLYLDTAGSAEDSSQISFDFKKVRAGERMKIQLAPAGGFALHLHSAPKREFQSRQDGPKLRVSGQMLAPALQP